MNGCAARHHPDVAHVVDGLRAHRRVEHGVVLGLEVRGVEHRVVLGDVGDDVGGLLRRVPELRRARAGTVWFTNCIVPPPTSFFVFTSASSGSMPVVSQSIISPIVPVGASTLACALRNPWQLAERHGLVPGLLRGAEHRLGHELGVDLVGGRAVLAHHAEHRVGVRRVARERAGDLGDPRARAVRPPGHQRRDRAGPRAALVRVVGQAPGHQQRAEVRVAQPELAVRPRVLADLLGRVVGLADHDLLRREHDLDRVPEARDVELALLVEEPQQVQAREVARAVVEVHVLRARVRAVDPARSPGTCATR